MNNALLSSKSNEWETPQCFFDALNGEFNFTLDPCATHDNAKCLNYFTKEENGLLQSWKDHTVFCNPPYGREIRKWIKKAYDERKHATVVMLIPARTDTAYFHDYILGKADIRFLRGRLKFGGSKSNAPFPSMLVIYKKSEQ